MNDETARNIDLALDKFMYSTATRVGRTQSDRVSHCWELEVFQLRQETVDAFRDLVDLLKKELR